ncbi:aminotransferase class I/II-fold pyridoxal phosphate-dependent enzyme [Fluviispira multicolorata]|uniref:Aminotransferase class I/II-fold pyridoxal phosphate-dependent enzyme n=1 Tax=Fluviispira multicolorata TaxID=2654512 RepID=A0A833JDF8_9BACT|nr:aminotransferase class I/II-fold pyridoxal phosphate-dependent enzyme [Fluviispira multicolorata]KAB8030752.1 aminotransferase class I/II-fold pyridoxal phosphate-dependent enzyme [Fluviispira multicolorata]
MQSTNRIARRWNTTGKSIFSEMTALSKLYNAVNLGQGFPDYYGPTRLLEAISKQVLSCHNQYSPSHGEEPLRREVSYFVESTTGVIYDPDSEITITSGASEALYSAINAFVNPGDKVLVFEPAFDLYYQAIANAGGEAVPVRLHSPDTPVGVRGGGWSIDWSEFDSVAAGGFSLIVFNSPHNPSGKVFSEEEIDRISSKILKNNAIVLSDEVYENLTYDSHNHISLCTIPKIQHLVVRISSAAKTFGFTGLKTGWICAPANLTDAIRIVHQATVFCTSPFTQLGLAEVMSDKNWLESYLNEQKKSYAAKRNYLKSVLERAGYQLSKCEGTFFITANFEGLAGDMSDVLYARQLVETHRVATIPVSVFYKHPPKSLPWIRFAFCKKDETLHTVADLLLNS